MYCSPIVLLAAAGIASSSHAQSGDEPARFVRGVNVAQIQIDPSTGARTAMPWGTSTRGASNPLWLNNNTDPCLTGELVWILDDPDTDGDGASEYFGMDCVSGLSLPCEGAWYNYVGDLHHSDAVIDRIVIRYGTNIPDVDLDSDGIGDGVPGFDICINFADRDNGFGAESVESGRQCIIELCIEDLPGMVGQFPPGFVAVYEVVIDLGLYAPSLVFELGDADGIDDAGTGHSGGAIYGAPTFSDLDAFPGHDFSWGVRVDQSGIPQAERGVVGVVTASPKEGNPGDLPAHSADAFGTYIEPITYRTGPSCPPDTTILDWGTFFPNFSCDAGGDPYASSFIELHGRDAASLCSDTCDVADYVPPCGVRDFSDVIAFITFFSQEDSAADLAAPFGTLDFSDILVFLTAFENGCP